MNHQEDKVIIGSCISKNVELISSALENKVDSTVVESWGQLESKLNTGSRLIFLTDLNLTDYFPSVVFDNMLEIGDSFTVIILLEDVNNHLIYRKRAHDLWEILPMRSVNDGRFFSVLEASQLRREMWVLSLPD